MLLAVLAALATGAPEAAPAIAAPGQKPAAAEAKAKSDMICKEQEVTGSRFPKKVCYSKADAESVRALEQQRLRQNQGAGQTRVQ